MIRDNISWLVQMMVIFINMQGIAQVAKLGTIMILLTMYASFVITASKDAASVPHQLTAYNVWKALLLTLPWRVGVLHQLNVFCVQHKLTTVYVAIT